MTNQYTYKDIVSSLLTYLIILLITGYYKYDIIYNRMMENNSEQFYKTIFLSSNVITSLVAIIFLIIIICLVWFTADVKSILSRSEFIHGSTLLIFTLAGFELIKFVYILFDLENQVKEIAVDTSFIENIQKIDFVLFSNYVHYLSYLTGALIFVGVLSFIRKKVDLKVLLIGLSYLVYLSFVQYIF